MQKKLIFRLIAFLVINVMTPSLQGQNGWVLQNSGTTANLNDLYFADKDKGWCVGSSGCINSTTDGGKTWHNEYITSFKELKSITFTNDLTGWIVGYGGTILKTTDGGEHWNQITTSITADLVKIFFLDKNIGWILGKWDIFKTTDGGINWVKHFSITPLPMKYFNDIFFTDQNKGWAVGRYLAYKTIDGGASWLPDSGLIGSNNAIYFINKDLGFLCRSYKSIKTKDGGNTWQQWDTLNSKEWDNSTLTDISFENSQVGWSLYNNSSSCKVFKTLNGGESWFGQNIVQYSLYLNQIFAIDENTAFCIGRNGTILALKNNGITTKQSYLDANNIKTVINPDNILFNDLSNNTGYFLAPKNDLKSTIFTSSLWIGGFDDGGTLHVAAQTYRQNGTDFWSGPIDTVYRASANPADWDKCWKVESSTIQNHISNWNKTGYIIPEEISSWPANGTGTYAKLIAPFADLNHNQIYEPTLGEYPEILGNQAAYFICNDNYAFHGETRGGKFGIEVHGMAYEFGAPWVPALDNTVLVKYKIINRSTTNYRDVMIGVWTDFDIGYLYDDYVGSDSARSMYFGYNGDNFDEGPDGYGNKPPSQAVVFLSDQMSHFMYYDNDFSIKGNPSDDYHYYYYLSSKFKNGQKMRYGGDGFNNVWDLTTYINYMYPGNPRNQKPAWSEVTSGHTPGDRRALGSIGPMNLPAGTSKEFTIAYVFSQPDTGGFLASYDKLLLDVDVIRDLYNRKIITGLESNDLDVKSDMRIYPNPATDKVSISFSKANNKPYLLRISDLSGRVIFENPKVSVNTTSYATSALAKGVYFITIVSDDTIFQRKLIVQ